MNYNNNILVTGAGPNGFLGRHIKNELSNFHGVSYIGREYNLIDFNETYEALTDHQADIIVHLAASCGGILANKNSPADFLTQNTLMAINVYEAARKYSQRKKKSIKIYALGSCCAYPTNCPAPFKEDDLFNGMPEITNAPYGQAKRTLLMLGQSYRKQYNIGGAHLIPANLMGEYDHFDLKNSHVIPALINKFTNAVKNNLKTVECFGTGVATREFLYAGDCAKAIRRALSVSLDTPNPINIGTGKNISIKNLATLIANITKFKGEIVFTGEVSDGQMERQLDVSMAKKMLNWEATTSLEEALRKTIKWYTEQKELIKYG